MEKKPSKGSGKIDAMREARERHARSREQAPKKAPTPEPKPTKTPKK